MTEEQQLNVADELKRLSRRIEDLDKTVSRISADREILEDVLGRLLRVEEAIHLQRSTSTETAKNIKEDIQEVRDVVEAKVGEVSQNIDDKTVVVKSEKQSVVQNILHKIGGEK